MVKGARGQSHSKEAGRRRVGARAGLAAWWREMASEAVILPSSKHA
jgi:hypothetical protein